MHNILYTNITNSVRLELKSKKFFKSIKQWNYLLTKIIHIYLIIIRRSWIRESFNYALFLQYFFHPRNQMQVVWNKFSALLGFSWFVLVLVLVYGFPILFYVSEFLIIKCWIGMIWLWLLRRRCGRPLAYYRTHNMTVKEVPLKLSWHKGSYLGSSYWILRNSNITFLHSGTQQLFNAD